MAFSCGAKLAKGVLITFNLLFWFSGCALIAFGVFFLMEEEKSTLFPLFKSGDGYADLQYLAFGFIGIGGLVFIVGFFGCFGALQEHKCMLGTYFFFLIIILGAELSVGILAAVFQNKNDADIENMMKENMKKYGVDPLTTKAMDFAQTKFQCCGVASPADYTGSTWQKNEGSEMSVAPTCCVLGNANDSNAYMNPEPINETLCQREDVSNGNYRHHKGCFDLLETYIKKESGFFIAIGCGISALEIFGMIFSICQCREI